MSRDTITKMKEVEGIVIEKNHNTMDNTSNTKGKFSLEEIRNKVEKGKEIEKNSSPRNLGKKLDRTADR